MGAVVARARIVLCRPQRLRERSRVSPYPPERWRCRCSSRHFRPRVRGARGLVMANTLADIVRDRGLRRRRRGGACAPLPVAPAPDVPGALVVLALLARERRGRGVREWDLRAYVSVVATLA